MGGFLVVFFERKYQCWSNRQVLSFIGFDIQSAFNNMAKNMPFSKTQKSFVLEVLVK